LADDKDDFKDIDEKKEDKDDKKGSSGSSSRRSDPNSVDVFGNKLKINDLQTGALAVLALVTGVIGTKIFAPQIIDDILSIGKKKEEPKQEEKVQDTISAPHEVAVGSNNPVLERNPNEVGLFDQPNTQQINQQLVPNPNEVNIDVSDIGRDKPVANRLKKVSIPTFKFRQYSRIKSEEPKRDYISLENK
jgi:hypothetical protein